MTTSVLEIAAAGTRAAVSLHGAELRRWSVAGHDILWTPDATVWNAVAPVLFPVVGWTRGGTVRIDGRTYPLGLHGFASERTFTLADRSDASLRLVDRADAESWRLYPFDYRLTLEFAVSDAGLSCVAEVANEGDRLMPYAFGLHPGFRWPQRTDATIVFQTSEEPSVPEITPGGLFANDRRPVPLEDRRLAVTRDLMAREALCFLDIRSAHLTYEAPDFGRLRIEHENVPHIALWSRPPAPYLCIESWTGHGDPDGFEGDLRDKPSMRLLPPGGRARHVVRYAFEPAQDP